jgi:hypothetical protein
MPAAAFLDERLQSLQPMTVTEGSLRTDEWLRRSLTRCKQDNGPTAELTVKLRLRSSSSGGGGGGGGGVG